MWEIILSKIFSDGILVLGDPRSFAKQPLPAPARTFCSQGSPKRVKFKESEILQVACQSIPQKYQDIIQI